MSNLDFNTYVRDVLPFFERRTKYPYRDMYGYVTIGVGMKLDFSFKEDYHDANHTKLNDVLKSGGTVYSQEEIAKQMKSCLPDSYMKFFPPGDPQTHTHTESEYGKTAEKPYSEQGKSPFYEYLIHRQAIPHWKGKTYECFKKMAEDGWTDNFIIQQTADAFNYFLDDVTNKDYRFFLVKDEYVFGEYHFKVDRGSNTLTVKTKHGIPLHLPLDITLGQMSLSNTQKIALVDIEFQGAFFSMPKDTASVDYNLKAYFRAILFLATYLRYAKKHKNMPIDDKSVGNNIVKTSVFPKLFLRQVAPALKVFENEISMEDYLNLIEMITHNLDDIDKVIAEPHLIELASISARYLFRMNAILGVNFSFTIPNVRERIDVTP